MAKMHSLKSNNDNECQKSHFRGVKNFDLFFHSECTFMPCNATHLKINQCLREDKMMDGKVDCRNRADEEAFQTSVGNSTSLLLDLDKILIPCNTWDGFQGFKCFDVRVTGVNKGSLCLEMFKWCSPDTPRTCSELEGTTNTGKTIDPQLCSNQSFWEHKTCNSTVSRRCTGDTPGQCGYVPKDCKDGSGEIKPSEDGDCKAKDDLMCKARDGKWAGRNICLKKKFLCDKYVQCEDGKDEGNCEDEYLRKRTFLRDHHYVCRSPFLEIRTEENKTGKFFPMRAIR